MTVPSGQARSIFGRFATGVAVVASVLDDEPVGMTANAITSVSLAPPMLLFCGQRDATTSRGIVQSGCFSVNFLRREHVCLAERFAQSGPDKFERVVYQRGVTGAPVLFYALGTLECLVRNVHDGGDHFIFVASVEQAEGRAGGMPLLTFRGAFHSAHPLDGPSAPDRPA
jgi:3-hydroxy-9,10-secoandrosta-1,3,5(10)-triene-9,17-dione monooxygenase reductase component